MRHDARLAKLEALRLRLADKTKPLSIAVFGLDNCSIGGYACGDTLFYREAGESISELQSRCCASIARADSTQLNFFQPF